MSLLWRTVFGWIPVPVVMLAEGKLSPFAGRAIGPVVCIDKRYESDEGLIAHELTHVEQFWRTAGLHPILYRFSENYRYKAELEAYRKQLTFNRGSSLLFATFIVSRYGLNVAFDDVLQALNALNT